METMLTCHQSNLFVFIDKRKNTDSEQRNPGQHQAQSFTHLYGKKILHQHSMFC